MVVWDEIAVYRWDGGDNFGDAPLNDYLLPRLFPQLVASHRKEPRAVLLGVGSILGLKHCMPKTWQNLPWIVYGSGFQYEQLDIPSKSVFFAVRGRKTLHLCRQNRPECFPANWSCALSDPAVLLPMYLHRDVRSRRGSTATIMKWDWPGSESTSLFTTRVNGDFLGWIRKLWSSERIVTDSLHAAIVADAYRIPWRPLRWEFKWADHFEQMHILAKPSEFVLTDGAVLRTKQRELEVARMRLIDFVCRRS